MPETKISDIIKSSLNNIREMVDANTIIGNPISTPGGIVILPVSKISVGVATGGLDFAPKKDQTKDQNFGGGGGTGLNVSPIAFLVIHPDGNVELLNVNNPTEQSSDTLTSLVGFAKKAPGLISKVKSMIKKDGNNSEEEDEPEENLQDSVID